MKVEGMEVEEWVIKLHKLKGGGLDTTGFHRLERIKESIREIKYHCKQDPIRWRKFR